MCYYFKPCIEIKHIDIARHRYRLLVRGYEGFIAQRPQIGGHRDFNLSIHVRDYLNWIHDIQDKTPCIALTLFKHENGRVE